MQSQAQWRYLFATDKPFAREWARETPGGKGRRYRRLRQRAKESGYGARAGEVIRGNLKRGNDGKFTSAGAGGGESTPSPKKPSRRSENAAARRERASAEAERRAQEDADEQAARDEEDAKLDAAKTPRERNAIRQANARARRERANERRAARRERAAAEREARTQEDSAAEADAAAPKEPKPKAPKKGGGGGKGGTDPAKAAAAAQREQERQARQAEQAKRRAESDARREARDAERAKRQAAADARRAAIDARRAAADAQRAERTARELTDLSQRAQTPGERLTDTQWQRLIVEGLAERSGGALRLTPAGQRQATRKPQATKAFTVFKDARGQWRWIARSSTAFRDRDDEIVATKALAEDCDYADATGEYGPLRWWHCPGVDIGDCDYNAVSGRTLIEMGTFRNEALARAAAAAAPELELSIGFKHLPDEPGADGVYSFIRRFERSLVPRGRASNPYTAFAVTQKEQRMTPEKLKAALEKLGSSPEARALMQSIIADAQTREKEAEAAGIAYKSDDAPAALPVYALADGTQGVIVDGAFVALKATGEKAPMPPAEMVDAGETELEDGEAELMEDEAGGDNLLSPAEISAIASAVAAELMGSLDGIAAKMAAVDEELKGRGYQKMKEASEKTLPAIAATLTSLKATVDELAGNAPARGHRPSEDNPDIEALLEAALKGDGEEIDPSDELAAVMKFLRPAAV